MDQSLSPNAPIMTYLWELGDGTTAYGPEVIYFYQAGGYDVTLTAILEDGSQSVVKREVIIMNDAPNIVSNLECWDIGNLTLECEIEAADKFNDLTAFNIHFGDSEILPENIVSQSVTGSYEVISFTHTYAQSGNYEVNYQVLSGRGEELLKAKSFDVSDTPGNLAPIADLVCFTYFDQVDCQAYGSFDPDGFITEYRFSFGNGESITTNTPQTFYTYPEVGTYTVTLEVVDNFGVSSATTQIVTLEERVNQFPVANLSCFSKNINELTCDGSASYDVDGELTLGRLIALETGDSFEASDIDLLQKTFSFSTSGAKEIKLEIIDNDGAIVEDIRTYFPQEAQTPQVAFICQSNNLGELSCDGSTSTAGDGEIVSYDWDIDGQQFSGPIAEASGISSESVNVKLTVRNSFGMENFDIMTFNIVQSELPIADFNCSFPGPWAISCKVNFEDIYNGVINYKWEIRDKVISTRDTGNIQFFEGGEIVVMLTLSDGSKISEKQKTFVLVENLPPSVSINQLPLRGNPPYFLNLSSSAIDTDGQISTYKWDVGGVNYSGKDIQISVENGNEIPISLIVTDNLGSSSSLNVIHFPNKAPIGDLSCIKVTDRIECDTSRSIDPDGLITNKKLSINSLPIEIGSDGLSVLDNPIFGENKIEYFVKDNEGLITKEEIILPFENTDGNPIAKFIHFMLPEEKISLNSSPTLEEGVPISEYRWTIDGDEEIVTQNTQVEISLKGKSEAIIKLVVVAQNGLTSETTQTIKIFDMPVRAPASISNTGIVGTDSDNDGIRDDYQFYMLNRVKGEAILYRPLAEIHRSIIDSLQNDTDTARINGNNQNIRDQLECLASISNNIDFAIEIAKEAFSETLNNKDRLLKYLEINKSFSALGTLDETKFEEYRLKCVH